MMMTNDSEEITSLKIDEHLDYLIDSKGNGDATWSIVQEVQRRDFNHEDDCNHKYRLPELKEFQSFSSQIYDNYQNIGSNKVEFESDWRLLYQVKGKVIFNTVDAFFAELYFNMENHYLLLVVKGTSTIGNVWSDLKNVVLDSKGGEIDSAFTFGEKVRVLMNDFKCKPMLLITGHSLGGYLAQIITYTITYCFVDGGKVKTRKEPMDDFGIYTVVFDSPAALKQISSIVPRDPIQHERFRLPIVNFIVDVNIINSNSTVGPHHLGQVISVKKFEHSNAPNMLQRMWKANSAHGIKNFEDISKTDYQQVEYLLHTKTVTYVEKNILNCFFSSKNFERLQKYSFFAAMSSELEERLPKFKVFSSHIFLQNEKVSPEEFIPRAHRFLSQCKDDLDNDAFDGKNVIFNAIYNSWKAEMLKDGHELSLNEKWIQKVQNWKDGTKFGGFESHEEMRFVGCMLHNSIPSCFLYDYEQFSNLDKKLVENFKATNTVTLILIVKNKFEQIFPSAENRVKIVYLVQDSFADEKLTFKPSELDAQSQELLKNTQLQFMENEVSALDIFGNELMDKLTIWEIYNFSKAKKETVPKRNHFYSDQAIISNRSKYFKSAVEFARELLKKQLKFVLISNEAGMGKSTALMQIALTLQQKLPNNWIVHINLFDIQTELSSAKDTLTSTKTAVEFARNVELKDRKSDEVLIKVFNWKLQDQKIVFLFDSLDEVCPLHRETVVKFIELLRETQLQIVLTTRPHEGKNFINADHFKLKPLDQHQRRNFIIQKFKMLGKKPPSDTEKWLWNINYVSQRINNRQITPKEYFWSLPMNLNIATSVYDAEVDIAESSALKGKTNIYEVFLTKSVKDTLKIKYNLEKNEHQAASHHFYIDNIDKFNKLCDNLAVCLLFHGAEIKNLVSKETKEKIKKNGKFINRFDVVKLDNKCELVSFLHRSYAEYLVAQVFIKCHQKDNCQSLKLSNEQLKRIYFKDEFFQVRKHICSILASSQSVKMDFIPFFMIMKGEYLQFMIQEDSYELYLQLKNIIKFSYKYSIFGFKYFDPLYLALENAREEFVRQLIEDGAKFEDTLNEDGVLHLALKKGLFQEVKDHFEILKVKLEVCHQRRLPLQYAAEYASKDIVNFLIEKGAEVKAEDRIIGKNALFYAIKANNAEVCELLIAKGVECTEALNYATQFGWQKTFIVFYKTLEEGMREEHVRNAHFEAVKHGNLDIFKHICGLPEANPLALNSKGDTFLHCAAERNHLHFMHFIVEYMNQSVDARNRKGETALMSVFKLLSEEMVESAEWLLDQKADVQAVDHEGMSCLHWAARSRYVNFVEMCLDAGADVNSQDNYGRTAIFHATSESKYNAVKILLEKGANPETTDKDGNTCLHAACKSMTFECVKLLVELLPLNCTNSMGETPLHLAELSGNKIIVAFLLEKAKKQNQESDDDEINVELTKRMKELEWDLKSDENVKNGILDRISILKELLIGEISFSSYIIMTLILFYFLFGFD